MVKASKRKQLEAAGWKVGSASEFLELTDAEEMLINMKLALAANVKTMRQRKKMTQQELEKRIGSSQSRVAKMEIADRSVSMELFVRSLAALGASRSQIGKIVGAPKGQAHQLYPRLIPQATSSNTKRLSANSRSSDGEFRFSNCVAGTYTFQLSDSYSHDAKPILTIENIKWNGFKINSNFGARDICGHF